MPYSNRLHISDSVMQQLHDLSGESHNNPHRIVTAMMNAIKSSMMKIKAKNIIVFLKCLKSNNIGTNEIEHSV